MIGHAVTDSHLSFKARGIYAFLATQPDGYNITAAALAGEGPDGRDSTLSGLRELERGGYLRRSVVRSSAGTLTTVTVLVAES